MTLLGIVKYNKFEDGKIKDNINNVANSLSQK
jgi:hypothetical protein